ncbi:MAG: class E sortase [Gaiellaceae bacterium]
MRRAGHKFGTLLVIVGLGTITWVGVTWVWEDPFTSLWQRFQQRELADRYERQADLFRPGILVSGGEAPDFRQAARRYRRSLEEGDPVGRLRVRRLGIDMVVVEGTATEPLKRGPGRYERSFVPGERELVYVAGHRTTYGAPFSRIDRLRPGDSVFFELPYGTFEYRITRHVIVRATDVGVLRSRHREVVALQACEPRFFASHRYIAYAEPVAVTVDGTRYDYTPTSR